MEIFYKFNYAQQYCILTTGCGESGALNTSRTSFLVAACSILLLMVAVKVFTRARTASNCLAVSVIVSESNTEGSIAIEPVMPKDNYLSHVQIHL